MKILFLTWENFGTDGMISAFRQLGHEVAPLSTSQEELLGDEIGLKLGSEAAKRSPDIVFGFNYFPNVAKKTADIGLDYYAWVYDNPCVQLYSHTILLPTNHVYVFDSDTYLKFHSQGIKTISYLPMAATPSSDAGCLATGRYKTDVAFVGSLYDEKHNFYDRMMSRGVSDRTSGYLRGIMESQKQLYGVNLVESLLTDSVIKEMQESLPLQPGADSAITTRTLFAEYVINRKITAEERRDALTMLGNRLGNVALYTGDKTVRIPGCVNHGPIDPYGEAPAVYNSSRINLNVSLRSIVNGIPLRCFEIMGAGGFLLSSHAGDFAGLFEDGRDYVAYDGLPDMLDKCEYYLAHEAERREIAENGLQRIREAHTYVHRAEEMLGKADQFGISQS